MNNIQFICLIIAGILMYSVGLYQGYKYKEYKIKQLGMYLADKLLKEEKIQIPTVIYLLLEMYKLKIK